ncbi:MAG TPA: hypothetical protein VN962_18440 [Polyangia bacterium]|nr:hypothetical protein [Polyangia bacterium]
MFEDELQGAIETVCASSWLGLVARWALIGVVAAVILIRLRGCDFGWRIGAALFAIGATALVLLGSSVRAEAPRLARAHGGAPADDVILTAADRYRGR